MSDWVAAGFDAEAFWHKTPRLIAIEFKGSLRRLARERNGRAWLAYHVALFDRLKELPSFDRLLEPEDSVAAPASALAVDPDAGWQEEKRKMTMLAAAHNSNYRKG